MPKDNPGTILSPAPSTAPIAGGGTPPPAGGGTPPPAGGAPPPAGGTPPPAGEAPPGGAAPKGGTETPPPARPAGETPPPVTETVWPAEGLPPDYRARMLKGLEGDDLKAANNILERLGSPADVIKKLLNQERQLSAPRPKLVKPGKDAKPEEIAAYRKEMGIPETPDAYDIKLPDGVVLGDADKEVFKEFAPALHEAGLNNDQVSAVMARYLNIVEQDSNKLYEDDRKFRDASDKALRTEWGPDYERNLNAINIIMQDAPAGLAEGLLNGRLADGRKIGDTPEFVKFLSSLALQAVPTATLLPPDMPSGPTLLTEIAAIEADMKKDINAYFKDPAKQKRYGDLLAARDIQAAKGAR